MKWKIGNIEINNQIVLAPMAGISNPAFIKIAAELGLGLAYTELISAEAIVRNNKKTLDMLNGIETLKVPVGVQLFGSNADSLAKAAKIVTEIYPNVFIDINMGCPVPKVAIKSQAGSALLKDQKKVYEIVSTVVKSVSTPVTVKIRSGWDENSINAKEIAMICEQAGAKAITVHPRTRNQGYNGLANWNIIKEVKDTVNIPVIGNGDIKSCYDAKRMLEETKCDAVMIGRALLGNPWLIKECLNYLNGEPLLKITISDRVMMIRKHFDYLLQFKPEKVALLEMRSHIAWYLKSIPNSSKLRKLAMQIKTIMDFEEFVNEINL